MRTLRSDYLDELEGYLELGMPVEALRVAKMLLKSKTLTPAAFQQTVEAILILADRLRGWRRLVETAYERFPPRKKRPVRAMLFRFYVSISDWDAAFAHMPKRPQDTTDYLFGIWVLLELGQFDQCEQLFQKMSRFGRRVKMRHDLDIAAFIEASAFYLASKGRLNEADDFWKVGTEFDIFRENAWEGLIQIQAVRLYRLFESAHRSMAELPEDHPIVLPGNARVRKADYDAELSRYRSALRRILPEKKFWRYGFAFS